MKWNKGLFHWLVIVVIACAIYVPGIQNSFTFLDDHVQVVDNPLVKSLHIESIKGMFSGFTVGMYQPVTTFFYAVTYSLFGENPAAFHLLSLVVHAINCFLVFKLLRHFLSSKSIGFLLAVLFLVHPIQVESVAWISALSNLLFSLFFLLAFGFYLKYRSTEKKKHLVFCFILFILSCLSKSAAVVFPIILLAYDYYISPKLTRTTLLQKVPFFAISILFGVVTIFGRETAGHLSDLTETFSTLDRIFLVSHSFLFYPLKFIFPYPLSAFYPYPSLTEGTLPLIYYVSPLGILLSIISIYLLRKKRLFLLGVGWFVATIILVLQFVPFGNQITTDRYLYLPLFGLLLILGFGIQRFKSSTLTYVLSPVLVLLAILSFQRVAIWENDKTLWTSVLETHPTVSQAYNNLGSFVLKENKNKEAFQYFNQAIELQPNYADAYSNRGNLLAQAGNSEAAIKDFNQAIALQPHADAYFNRANEYSKLNRLQEAISDYSSSISLQPRADSYTNRAFAYLKTRNIDLAKQDLLRAQKINPKYGRAYFLQGILEQNLGNRTAACKAFLKAANLGEENAKDAYSKTCR
jgi:tetratricopeptide (TPR) repeat protein